MARFVAVLLLTLVLIAPCEAKRVALVIGNADYKSAPLANPINDARAVAAKLQTLGFAGNLVLRENLKRNEIGRTIKEFVSKIQPGDEVVVFYAGHGIQVKGVNYLPTVDADIESEEDVPLNSLNVAFLLDRLEEARAGVKLLFLDACRNNPFSRGFRGMDRGLAKIGDAPTGTLISFATRPGSVAADGDGKNGTYTAELLRYIDTPKTPVELLLKKVASAVSADTRGKQEPWVEGSIRGEFFFNLQSGAGTDDASDAVETREKLLWDAIKSSSAVEPFLEYLKRYPSGRYTAEANVLVAKLQAERSARQSDEKETQAWQAAEGAASQSAYEIYVTQYPNGKYAEIARAKIAKQVEDATLREETATWAGATDRSSLNFYIAKFPKGRFVGEARKRLAEIERRESTQSAPPEAQQRHVIPPVM